MYNLDTYNNYFNNELPKANKGKDFWNWLRKTYKSIKPRTVYNVKPSSGRPGAYSQSDLKNVSNETVKKLKNNWWTTDNPIESIQYLKGSSDGTRKGLLSGDNMLLSEYKIRFPWLTKNISFDKDINRLKQLQGMHVNPNEFLIPQNRNFLQKFLYPKIKQTEIKPVPKHIFDKDQLFYDNSIDVSTISPNWYSKPYEYIGNQFRGATGLIDMPYDLSKYVKYTPEGPIIRGTKQIESKEMNRFQKWLKEKGYLDKYLKDGGDLPEAKAGGPWWQKFSNIFKKGNTQKVDDWLRNYYNHPKMLQQNLQEQLRNVRNYNKGQLRSYIFKNTDEMWGPWKTDKIFGDQRRSRVNPIDHGYIPNINEKISSRISYNDWMKGNNIPKGYPGGVGGGAPLRFPTGDDINSKMLNRSYFDYLKDLMKQSDVHGGKFNAFTTWLKDLTTTGGLYYPTSSQNRNLAGKIQTNWAPRKHRDGVKVHEISHWFDDSATRLSPKHLDALKELRRTGKPKPYNFDDYLLNKAFDLKAVTDRIGAGYFTPLKNLMGKGAMNKINTKEGWKKYMQNFTEMRARMSELRHKFNMKPGDKFTMDHLNKAGNMSGMRQYLNVDDDPQKFLDYMNKWYKKGGTYGK